MSTVWVSCDGEAPADRDNIGRLTLHPKPGFPGYFYPYRNKPDYLSPLIAIHFENPKSERFFYLIKALNKRLCMKKYYLLFFN